MAADLRDLVVEVLHNRGDDKHPDWSVGSGFFVGTRLVLTALHNVDGEGELLVRVHGKEEYPAIVSLQGDQYMDLAVLGIADVTVDVPPLRYGAVDRSAPAVVERCWAVGFPQLKVLEYKRDKPKPPPSSAHVNGEIPTGEYLGQQLLTLQVRNSPRPQSQGSEWEGMSGAVVFSGDSISDYIVVGVITEHHLAEGESALTVVPITALDLLPEAEAMKWWKFLGVDRQAFVSLPSDEREQRLRSLRSWRHDFYHHILLSVRYGYVDRQEILDTVRSTLLSDLYDGKISSTPNIPLALQGMGGIGKTIIARVLCDDPKIQAAFPDGILAVTLGQTPELIPKMREWVNELGGTISENAPTVDSLKNILAKLFKDRVCLLILDDVWRRGHAEAFFVGGPCCRILLTTRDAEIARELGAQILPVSIMTKLEATALLEFWADGQLTNVDPDVKEQIAERLGYLPLALKLAGAQLRQKPPDEWLHSFDVSELQARRIEGIHDSIKETFELSLRELDAKALLLYTALAIFKKDEVIPVVAVERLWQSLDSSVSTTYLLDDLATRALLEFTSHHSSRGVRLHRLLHDLIDKRLEYKRIAIHQALLSAYRVTCRGTGWHTADDDSYLYDHLTYHLHAVGAIDELKGLFANQHWLQKRVLQQDYIYDGYLSDLALVWNCADAKARQQIKTNREPTDFAECIRYLLIQTSINSLTGNYFPEFVAQAVETGLWSPRRAQSTAAKIPDEVRRGKMYIALLKTAKLSNKQREEAQRLALEAILALPEERTRAEVLGALAPHLTGEYLERALQAAFALSQERAGVLTKLALHLTGERRVQVQEQALKAVLTLSKERDQPEVLGALAPQLTGQLLEQALDATLALPLGEDRAWWLRALAPQLTRSRLDQALEAASVLSIAWNRAWALEALALHLTGERRVQVQEQALETVITLPLEHSQAWVLAALAPQLTGKLFEQALEATLALPLGEDRAWVLAALAPQLPAEKRFQMLEQALDDALALPPELGGVRILRELVPQLAEEQLERVLEATLVKSDGWEKARVLIVLAPNMTGERRIQVLGRTLEATLAISSKEDRAQVLEELAPQLAGEQLERVLQAALTFDQSDEDEWVWSLSALAPYITGKMQDRVLEVALALSQKRNGLRILKALTPQLTEGQLERSLEVALASSDTDERERAGMLEALAPQLTEKQLERALIGTLSVSDEWERAGMLEALAPLVTGEMQEQVLKAALAFSQKPKQVVVLTKLTPRLAKKQLKRVLKAALALPQEFERAFMLKVLAPHLTGAQLKQALEAALTISGKQDQAEVFAALAPQLTEEKRVQMLEQALDDALTISHEVVRSSVLEKLVPHLREEQLKSVLESALAISYESFRSSLLFALVPHVTGEMQEQVLKATLALSQEAKQMAVLREMALYGDVEMQEQVLKATFAFSQEDNQAAVLKVLALYGQGEVQEQVLKAAVVLSNEENRAKVLEASATHVTEKQSAQVLTATLSLSEESRQLQVLTALAPRLIEKQLVQVQEAVLSLSNEEVRTKAMITFLPYISDPIRWLQLIRETMLDTLLSLQYRSRKDTLFHLYIKGLYRPTVFSSEVLGAIASHIIETCQEWHWLRDNVS